MKEMSSTSPWTTGSPNFDINVEDVAEQDIPKHLYLKDILKFPCRGRQFLPPLTVQAERDKKWKRKIIQQNQTIKTTPVLWHAPCKIN